MKDIAIEIITGERRRSERLCSKQQVCYAGLCAPERRKRHPSADAKRLLKFMRLNGIKFDAAFKRRYHEWSTREFAALEEARIIAAAKREAVWAEADEDSEEETHQCEFCSETYDGHIIGCCMANDCKVDIMCHDCGTWYDSTEEWFCPDHAMQRDEAAI